METISEMFNLEDIFELVPVSGHPDLYTVRTKESSHPAPPDMTEADWDKFEKDIDDAFEQVP